jgi:hypothetical protein
MQNLDFDVITCEERDQLGEGWVRESAAVIGARGCPFVS